VADRPDNVCGCGQQLPQVDKLKEQLATLRLAHEELQKELIVVRANNRRLTNDRNAKRLADPLKQRADAIFEHWNEKLMGGRAREFSGKRLEAVLQRLRAVPVDELEERAKLIHRAIEGVALKPYVTDKGRSAAGRSDEKQVELELICRNEANVHRYAGYMDVVQPQQVAGVPTSGHHGNLTLELLYGGNRPDPYERALTVLRIEYGADTTIAFGSRGRRREFYAVCPAHDHHLLTPPTLRAWEKEGVHGNSLEFVCERDCLPSMIRQRLVELERGQAQRTAHDGDFRRLAHLLAAVDPLTLVELVPAKAAV
jgi:hypothetical protein